MIDRHVFLALFLYRLTLVQSLPQCFRGWPRATLLHWYGALPGWRHDWHFPQFIPVADRAMATSW
jgi:hypothetical protein